MKSSTSDPPPQFGGSTILYTLQLQEKGTNPSWLEPKRIAVQIWGHLRELKRAGEGGFLEARDRGTPQLQQGARSSLLAPPSSVSATCPFLSRAVCTPSCRWDGTSSRVRVHRLQAQPQLKREFAARLKVPPPMPKFPGRGRRATAGIRRSSPILGAVAIVGWVPLDQVGQ